MAIYFQDQGKKMVETADKIGGVIEQGLAKRKEKKFRKAMSATMEEARRIRENREAGLGDDWRTPMLPQPAGESPTVQTPSGTPAAIPSTPQPGMAIPSSITSMQAGQPPIPALQSAGSTMPANLFQIPRPCFPQRRATRLSRHFKSNILVRCRATAGAVAPKQTTGLRPSSYQNMLDRVGVANRGRAAAKTHNCSANVIWSRGLGSSQPRGFF